MADGVQMRLDYVGKTRRDTTKPDAFAAAGSSRPGEFGPAEFRAGAREPAASRRKSDNEIRRTDDFREVHEDRRRRHLR